MFGYGELSAAIQCGGTSLLKLRHAVPFILSFVRGAMTMALLCAIPSGLRAWAQDAQSWSHSTIDARSLKPCGQKAHRRWQLWHRAKHVIGGDWAHGNVGLLMSSNFGVWRWVTRNGCSRIPVCGSVVSISQSPVPSTVTLLMEHVCDETVVVGLASTRQPRAIMETLSGSKDTCAFFGVAITPVTTLLIHNDKVLNEDATHQLKDGSFVTVALDGEQVELTVSAPSALPYRQTARHGVRAVSTHELYCAAICDAPCQLVPCWSLL